MKKIILLSLSFLVLATFFPAGSSFATTEDQGVKIPVLMYHHLSNDVTSESVVTPAKFRHDITVLKREGYTAVFLTDIVDYLNGHIELPEKPIVITFDDGYSSNYDFAYPIAKLSKMKITISVIGWSLGRNSFMDGIRPITPHFGWEEMRKMLSSGYVDIQNHTTDLHTAAGLSYGFENEVGKGVLKMENESYIDYESRIKSDLLSLNVGIFQETRHMPTFFFYPYGAYDEHSERALSKMAFLGSVTTEEGVRAFRNLDDLRLIPRLNVTNDLSGADLIKKIESLEIK